MNFPPQQEGAMLAVSKWMRNPAAPQVLYLAGYAGTGKTTLARYLVDGSGRRWLFAALTGKAAHVLRQKGCGDARTIHSLIYRPNGESKTGEIRQLESKIYELRAKMDAMLEDDSRSEVFLEGERNKLREGIRRLQDQMRKLHEEREPMFAVWANSPLADYDVEGIVIDECSMVDDRLGEDLESFGKKILVLGDPAQLPPVGAGSRYTNRDPDVMLTEVHRQARESGVLRLATAIRNGDRIDETFSGDDCEVVRQRNLDRFEIAERVLWADQVIVGRNATRRSFNKRHRELLERKSVAPEVGDRLVCLRNNRQLGLFNGSQWVVLSCDADLKAKTCELELTSEDGTTSETVSVSSWLHPMLGLDDELSSMGWSRRDLEEFDFSYALTGHKSQGSQWDRVTVFDESRSFGRETGRRWLYTTVTRAARELKVIL